MPTQREATEILDRDFLETRSRLLDVAATLDRLDRASVRSGSGLPPDRRLTQIRQAIEALIKPGPGRSETVQRLFSLDYNPGWPSALDVVRARSSS